MENIRGCLVSAPVKIVLRGYEVKDGYIVADNPYSSKIGLITSPEDTELSEDGMDSPLSLNPAEERGPVAFEAGKPFPLPHGEHLEGVIFELGRGGEPFVLFLIKGAVYDEELTAFKAGFKEYSVVSMERRGTTMLFCLYVERIIREALNDWFVPVGRYHSDLPPELKKCYCLISDIGRSILVVLVQPLGFQRCESLKITLPQSDPYPLRNGLLSHSLFPFHSQVHISVG